MAGIKHKFHQYYGLTQGDFSTEPEERLKQMLDVPTICQICGNAIQKYGTGAAGAATQVDHYRWAEEERLEKHLNCIQKQRQGTD